MGKDGATGVVLIYTTLPSLEDANRIADVLIAEKLAACVNILPGMTSVYEWQGDVEHANEAVCLVKTSRANAVRATDRIAQLHPYETPAILTVDAAAANDTFAQWVARQTRS